MNYKGMTALVTGASSGLGEEFAKQLAARGANLVLVARTEDKLKRLAVAIQHQSKVEVTVLPVDLSSTETDVHPKCLALPGAYLDRQLSCPFRRHAKLMPRNMILRVAAGTVKNLNQK